MWNKRAEYTKEKFMEHWLRFVCIVCFFWICTILACTHNMKVEKSMECWVVVEREFKSTQYAGQESFWVVKIWTWYKSFNTYDYVVEWDEVCKKSWTWKKEDWFIKQIKEYKKK